MQRTTKCVICGKPFIQYTSRHLTCSDRCRNEYNKQRRRKYYWNGEPPDLKTMRECPVCGTLFSPKRSGKTYCSKTCQDKSRRIGPKEYSCVICGKTFSSVRPKAVCSDKCRREREKENAKKRIAKTKYCDTAIFTCVICGRCFIDARTSTRKTCSHKCAKEYAGQVRREHRDKRLTDENIVDRNISLKKLFDRDGGICWICGQPCVWEDRKKRKKRIIPGPLYPTIDHVIPLARGGLHAWDNVRLAHWECNIKKSDAIVEEDEALPPKYSISSRAKNQKKKTAQVSKDGKLIRIYESTREAAAATGIKQKGIQKCARHEAPTYGGYRWVYLDDTLS